MERVSYLFLFLPKLQERGAEMGECSRMRASAQLEPNWDLGVKVKLWIW